MGGLVTGQIVASKRGRDRGTLYVVVGLFAEGGKQYAYLADGDRRKSQKPKKKKSLHIQPTNAVIPFGDQLSGDAGVVDAYLRKMLKEYSTATGESPAINKEDQPCQRIM